MPQPRSRARRRERAQATEPAIAARHESGKSKTGRKVTFWIVGSIAVVALATTGWLGFRVLTAKASLEAAQEIVGTVKDQASEMDFAAIADSSDLLTKHTATALEQTRDPLWQAGESIPGIGQNLTAVREMAEVIDSVATGTVAPLAGVAGGLSTESLKPVDGRLNIEPIVALSEAIGPATDVLKAAAASGSQIDTRGTIGEVQAAGTKLTTMLDSADEMMTQATSILKVAPDLLGANGPRTFVLLFQNLAEATPLGGTAAALTEIKVDNGAISIGRQASSGDFPWLDGRPIVTPDPSAQAIFGSIMYERLNLSTSRPDFPTAAVITQAFWEQHIGGAVDGVISVDPVALSYMLEATGPVAMSTGDQLSSDNAVSLLLNEVYFRYQDDITMSDAFFAEAAKNVFDALMSPATNPGQLVAAMGRSITEHRIMAWSSHAEQQEALATSILSGMLPTTNDDASTVGVFFRDMSASKMDFYLKTAATLTSDACTSDTPTFTMRVALMSDISPELAATLPPYVASGLWGSEKFKTQVFVYGPPGTTLASTNIDLPGESTTFDLSATDLNRPVATFMVSLIPGQSSELTATFTGGPGVYGPPAIRTTPMLNPTAPIYNVPGCE